MKNTYLSAIICIICCVYLNGCTSALSKTAQYNTARTPVNPDIQAELVAAAKSVESSLALLASSQEQQHVPLLNTTPLVTPEGGMGGTVDVDWSGPMEPLVRKIADMSEYKVKVLGNAPAIPIIISISQQKAVIADVLKNAGMQAGKRANIVVFPANRVIEVRYANMG